MARKPVLRPSSDPSDFAPVDAYVVTCFKAMALGTASPEQMRDGVKFIVHNICATYDLSYRPGPDGERTTAFAEGKRQVGLQIVRICEKPFDVLVPPKAE